MTAYATVVHIEVVKDTNTTTGSAPRRYITLGSGRTVTLGEYTRSWKKLLTLPPQTKIANWQWYEVSAAQILCDIRKGINDRINSGIPAIQRGATA